MTAKIFYDPGALSHELALEQCIPVPDGLGGHAEDWVEIATLFGRLVSVSAASVFGAAQTIETTTHRVTIRHRADVLAGMRFAYDTRVFEIATVRDPDESGRYLVCATREVTT